MTRIKSVFTRSILILLLLINVSYADSDQMNTTLARISTILSQINPLINSAESQQDPDARVQFQFDALRADIGKIQEGLAEQLNGISIQPRVVAPLSGDYLPLPEPQLAKALQHMKEGGIAP